MSDLSSMPTADLAALGDAVAAELARRGRILTARQGYLFDDMRPLTAGDFDPVAALPDGTPRWIAAKVAAFEARTSVDAIERAVRSGRIGVKVGGRLWIDRLRLRIVRK